MYALFAVPFVAFVAILAISLAEIVDFRPRPVAAFGTVIGITLGATVSLLARLF